MSKIPTYYRHNCGQGITKWKGKTVYFGRYEDAASVKLFERFREQCQSELERDKWRKIRKQIPRIAPATIVQLITLYLEARPELSLSFRSHICCLRAGCEYLFRDLEVACFGVAEFKKLRKLLLAGEYPAPSGKPAAPCSRRTTNWRLSKLIGVFRWGLEESFVFADQLTVLSSITPLRNFQADEIEKVQVDWDAASKLKPFVSKLIWDIISLQYLCGMRPSEALKMRLWELDRSHYGEHQVWLYAPRTHKTAWKGYDREVVLGDRAIAILRPYVELMEQEAHPRGLDSWDYFFTARTGYKLWRKIESSRFHRAFCRYQFTPNEIRFCDGPIHRGWYCQSISNAIERAIESGIDMPRWSPHQLRHARSTFVDNLYGPTGFEALTGDRVTQRKVYVHGRRQLAMRIAKEVG